MNETNFQKIREILKEGPLSEEDQNNLLMIFSVAADEELETTVKLLIESPDLIEMINKNYKEKGKAIASKDSDQWQKIVKNEEAELQKRESQ